MKALVLNGIGNNETQLDHMCDVLCDELSRIDWHVDTLVLRDADIAPCMGCFRCWHCTPGKCVIEDDGRETAEKIIYTDLLVLVSPIRFGGYSSDLKKALDRTIPLVLPFFQKVNGEVHHIPRYERYPVFLVVGILPLPDRELEQIFASLIERNVLNFPYPSHALDVIYESDSMETIRHKITTLVTSLGVSP